MLLHNAAARLRHGFPVVSVVLLLRPAAMPRGVTGRVTDDFRPAGWLDFGYHLVKVWTLPPKTVLNAGVGVLPLVPLTAVKADELPPLIEAVKRRLEKEVPPHTSKDFLMAMRVLMGLKYQDNITETLMQSIFELTDSVEWQKIHRHGKDLGMAEGIAKGKVKGKAEGVAEGLLEGERRILIRLGTAKFGPPTQAVVKKLGRTADAEQLIRLTDRLLTANKWSDLFAE